MQSAALDRALGALGDRWSLQLVRALLGGPRRYNDLSTALGGIAPNILAARLRHLEAAGLVAAEPYQERPRRFEYRLTEDGRELGDVLAVLEAWAGRRSSGSGARLHDACGTPVEWRAWCPTCELPADDPDVWV
jgi:DNA-binding HxlR family transcriptional regulator